MSRPTLPALPLDSWEDSKTTLHLILQIVGKIRLALMPRRNHWWNVTLYVGPRGLGTGPIPYADGGESFELVVNLVEHSLEISTSTGVTRVLALKAGRSVAEVHDWLFGQLAELGIEARIQPRPYDLPIKAPFRRLTDQSAYDPNAVSEYFRLLRWVDGVFREFAGRFYGKTCPVHLYWHHMDLAVTRFSGKPGPPLPADRGIADKDAYSHEVVSFGFWPGDEQVRAPAFYSYTYPSPDGLEQEPLEPAKAGWTASGGSPMANLMWDDLIAEDDPRAALLAFLESAYLAGARRAGWDTEGFTVPPLEDL